MLSSSKTISKAHVSFRRYALIALCVLSSSFLAISPAPCHQLTHDDATVRLQGYVSHDLIADAHLVGHLAATTRIPLTFALPLRNQEGLNILLHQVYNPNDRLYGHYLKPHEFTAHFGPAQADYDAVTAFAQAHHFTIARTYPGRTLLDVTAPASVVEATFGLRLNEFKSDDGRRFYAPDAEPAVPASLSNRLLGIFGFNNAQLVHPLLHSSPVKLQMSPLSISGLTPNQIRTAYDLSSLSQDGTGQTLALAEFDGYAPSDVQAYEQQFYPARYANNTLPGITVTLLDGATGSPSGKGNGPLEVTLDIEMMIALAPGAAGIVVVEGEWTEVGVAHVYQQIATSSSTVASTSWAFSEKDVAFPRTSRFENQVFQQMALQGQTIYAASGDSGARANGSTLSVYDPPSQPYVVGVGGTTLRTDSNGNWASEIAWDNAIGATGGGISALWQIPDYQQGLTNSAQASHKMRNVPDVALNADPNTGYATYYGSNWIPVGGTSASAPLWAAFTALVNQGRQAAGVGPLGFANPAIYALGEQDNYGIDFHDITQEPTNRPFQIFSPNTGYDNATGWGSFDGANLFVDLSLSPLEPPMLPIAYSIGAENELYWQPVPGATQYYVYRGVKPGGEGQQIYLISPSTVVNDTNAQGGTPYYYQVTAIDANGESPRSVEVSAAAGSTYLPGPHGVGIAGDESVALIWQAVPGAKTYNVFRNGVPIATQVNATTYLDFRGNNGETDSYLVFAVNTNGQGNSGNEIDVTTGIHGVPAAPALPIAYSIGAENELYWQPVPGANQYYIYRGTKPGGEGQQIYLISPSTVVNDTNAQGGTPYYYQVTAIDANGESPRSVEVSAAAGSTLLPGPTVTGKVNSRKCKLTWTAVTGAVTYNVYRDGIPIKTLIKATSYTDAAVTHGTTYSYYVYAVDVDGQGNPSNEVDLTP